MKTLLTGIIFASILIQGGFYPTVFLVVTCILSFTSTFYATRKADCCEWLLWGLAGWYLLTSLANGYASESLGQACLPGACVFFLMVYRSLSAAKKAGLQKNILLGSGILAGVAVLAFCGVVPLKGAVISHRLQFTFQYANAAGSWFAAAALLVQDSKDSDTRRLLLPFITALFLTQSVGALGIYFILQLVRLWQCKGKSLWQGVILTHVVSGGFAIALYFTTGWISAIILILLYAAGWYWETLFVTACKLHLQWIALLSSFIGIASVLFTQRFSSGLRTFAERLIQIMDGCRIIAAHPLWGIGAGNWEKIYTYYQSAQYTSTVVHSSLIQIGVDAGILAVILAAAFLY